MKITEWIWTKIGFGAIAAIAGIIWAFVFFPVLTLFNPEVSLFAVVKIFITVFIVISFINEKLIGDAGLGAIYALFGLISGFLAAGGAPFEMQWSKYSKGLIGCFLAGVVSMLIVLI